MSSVTASTDTAVSSAGRWVVQHAPDWPHFVGQDWLDTIMTVDVPDREHRKQGRSIGRWTLTAPDGRRLVVFLKRHSELPRRHGWLARLFPGRAWSPGLQEWDHLQQAAAIGLPVPRAVAAGEWRGTDGRLKGFLAVEELTDQLPLHEAIPLAAERLSPIEFDRWKRGLIGELARLCHQLHGRRLAHRDLYLCHFYISEADTRRLPTGWYGQVTVIDFHRFTRVSRLGTGWMRVKELGQLLFSTIGVVGITPADRRQFWQVYRSFWGPSRFSARLVSRLAQVRAGRHLRHATRRAVGP